MEEVGGMSKRKLPQGDSGINRHSDAAKRAIEESVAIGRAAGKTREEVIDAHGDGCGESNY